MKLTVFFVLNLFYINCSSGQTGHFYLSFKNGTEFVVLKGGSPPNTVGIPWITKTYYANTVSSTGWDELEIISNPELKDEEQAYYAGWIEGFHTQKHIYYHWYNTQSQMCNNKPKTCNNIKQYLKTNREWIDTKIQNNKNDPYWHQVNLYYKQIKGLYEGYREVADSKESLSYEDVLWLNYVTDLMTLSESLADSNETKYIKKEGHCSALIKLLPGYSDVYFAHNAWITYNFMNRIVKRYDLGYHWSNDSVKLIPGQKQSFSSYPGVITSVDDFYIINSGLVVIETTNNVYDMEIYKNNKPVGQVLESVRSAVANRLAMDGERWAYFYSLMNSGTYNNQWMVVDLKQFSPGFEPKKGFLWVVEQMPGLIEKQDQTRHMLSHSYWASYNIPFYNNVYNYSGYNNMEKLHGSYYSYSECTRAKIFEREHESVVDLDSMINLIRYNHYDSDPYSLCEKCNPQHNACLAIASRCDLNPANGTYTLNGLKFKMFGAIDAKVGSYSMFKKGEMVSIAGPTWNKDIRPFQWSSSQPNDTPHLGQPDTWNFSPLTTSWLRPYQQANTEEPAQTILRVKIRS